MQHLLCIHANSSYLDQYKTRIFSKKIKKLEIKRVKLSFFQIMLTMHPSVHFI